MSKRAVAVLGIVFALASAEGRAPGAESNAGSLDGLIGEESNPGPAATAPSKPPPGQTVEEIVVTARKVEENIQEVPIAITAFSADDLQQTSTFEMKDLGIRVPNMSVHYGPAQPTAVSFMIRGQVQNDILGTLDPSVGFYDDGVYVARPHGANAAFVDVESLQVLRGPQGTLFGRNTTGGAVLLSTNAPDFEGFSGSVGATVGNFGRRSVHGVLNVPLVSDRLALRLVGQATSTDGFAFDEINRRDVATEGRDLLRAKLLYEPWDGLSVLLSGQIIDVDELGTPVKPIFALKQEEAADPTVCCLTSRNALVEGVDYDRFVGGDPDRVTYDPGLKPFSHLTVRGLTLTSVWEQPWATAKLIAGWRENDDAANHIDIDGSPTKAVDTIQANENFQQSYELQLTGSWLADRLGWAAGVVYFDESGMELGTTSAFVPLAAVINPILTPGDIDNDSIGGYVQGTYSLTPAWRVTGGVRHTRDHKRLVLSARMGPDVPLAGNCAVPEEMRDPGAECRGTFDDSFSNTSFLAGTDYQLFEDVSVFDDVMIYGSVTTGYRAGGQNLRGTSVETLQPFRPETLLQLEAGFKSDFLDRRVRLNAAGFYTLYDDIQRSIIVASQSALPATVVSNAADAEITGAEIEVTALPPVPGLTLGAYFGLTLPTYDKFVDVTGDRTSERFDDVPEKSYSLTAAHLLPVLDVPWLNRVDWSWTSEIPFGQGELRYFREQGHDIERMVNQPPKGYLSARSAVTLANGLEIGAWGRNLTDEHPFGTLVLGGGPDFVARLIATAGREYGVDVTYRF